MNMSNHKLYINRIKILLSIMDDYLIRDLTKENFEYFSLNVYRQLTDEILNIEISLNNEHILQD